MNYIYKDENALYFECGYSCDNAFLLSLGSEKIFITDGRYTTEAKEQAKGVSVVEANDISKKAREILRASKIKKIAYNPLEFSSRDIDVFKSKLRDIYLYPVPNLSQKKRCIKSESEIALIKKSVELNAKAFLEFANFIGENGMGMSEKRLYFEAKRILSDFGEYELSFDPIVGINANAAKPHAIPSQVKLKSRDILLFDAGIKYRRYCSDRTRTAVVGDKFSFKKEQNLSDKEMQKIYDTVRKAQEQAIEKARAGMRAKDIDRVAREVIEKEGYGKYFVHSLGHGVGLDIHELPRITKNSDETIEDGMVFTIEPGIYIADRFGVRIEDVVVIKEGRAEVL